MLHSPVRSSEDNPNASQSSRGSALAGSHSLPRGGAGHDAGADGDVVPIEAIGSFRLPPFWRAKPDLWFVQAEAALQLSRVRGDESKYNLVLSILDPDTLSDIEDVIRSPPDTNRYQALKSAILSRLTDSADHQLLKLFTQLELGDKRPSQLLRHMRGLSANRVPDDVFRIKWLNFLPVSAQRLLRIFKSSDLDELAAAADEIVETSPGVASASMKVPDTPGRAVAAAVGSQPAPQGDTREQLDRLASELVSVRFTVVQLISINREILARLEANTTVPRTYSPAPLHKPRSRARTPPVGTLCSYHRRWGAQAVHCRQPCSFGRSGQGN